MRTLITGAASGIGRSVALLAAASKSDRACLLLVDRDVAGLEATASAARERGSHVVTIVADLADPASVNAVVQAASQAFQGLDCVVSNAGILRAGDLKGIDLDAYEMGFRVNTRPTWLLGKAAHRMLAESKGCMVATASIAGEHPAPSLATYSPSKAALIMLVRQMAIEWGPDGIRCNCVSPGATDTDMTKAAYGESAGPAQSENRRRRERAIPLRRICKPDDVAQAVLFLASPAASMITGVNLPVDGGLSASLMPAAGGGTGYAEG